MISLKSVTTEVVEIEDFVVPNAYYFTAILCERKDNLKIDYHQRKISVLEILTLLY